MTNIRIPFRETAAALALVCLASINVAALQPPYLGGRVTDSEGNGIHNAVVMVKHGGNLLAAYRVLTDEQGNVGNSAVWVRSGILSLVENGTPSVVIRKAGYLPHTIENMGLHDGTFGIVTLVRDPLEARIDSVMAMMNTVDKIAQMTQPELGSGTAQVSSASFAISGTNYLWGSVLNGGSGYTSTFLNNMANNLNSWPTNRARIPTFYGKDAVHGNAGIPGYTVFPHNIGLGATRDSALVRRIGEATAKEMWAANIDLNFSPAVSVARDLRWGRTYESYGENAELSAIMGAAMVRGLQGERYNAPWRVTATAKHYLADGGTTNGKDRGNTAATDAELRAIHLPGYEAVVEQGVLSVMASFNTINNIHQHIDSLRLTGWLKTELGFDGYIISDWLGIANSNMPGWTDANNYEGGTGSQGPQLTVDAVRKAINAGVDLAMEPGTHTSFRTHLTTLVNNGDVSMERINDAVRRILRAKFRAGRMDNFAGPAEYVGNTANRAHADHRAVAREAVRKSQVLLKNENSALPIAKTASIHVFGPHHHNIGYQCGGWTISWLGVSGNSGTNFPNGTSILQGMQQVSEQSSFSTAANADVIVYVTGENPYAEWHGDIDSLNFPLAPKTVTGTDWMGRPTTYQTGTDTAAYRTYAADLAALQTYRTQGKTIVTIFVTGRPRIAPELIDASDAFLVAWLPGTEGGGVADILFGDHSPTGLLPFAWPGRSGTQFPYGFGLDFQGSATTASNERVTPAHPANQDAAAVTPPPAAITINGFSAGPNPVSRSSTVNFYINDPTRASIVRSIASGSLTIFDAAGNIVNKIAITDGDINGGRNAPNGRLIGSWNFTDSRGRTVAAGSYLVRGTIRRSGGAVERVSVVIGAI